MIIENRTFRLAAGVDEAAFREADHRVQVDFFYAQPGLVRRTTARDAGGEWLVVTLWVSIGDAEGAESALPHDPSAIAWTAMIDPGSVAVSRYETLD